MDLHIPTEKMKIWCLIHDQFAHVKPVESYLGDAADFHYDHSFDPAYLDSHKPDLLLCVSDSDHKIACCIDEARRRGVPSLLLQDGIIEWRCQYEEMRHGKGGGAPQYQPVITDKIACLGIESARHIAAWGNGSKVEVTGMPRLDVLLKLRPATYVHSGKNLLIMTARKPWFNEQEKKITIRSLLDLKEHFKTKPNLSVRWRLTKELNEIIGVENSMTGLGGNELSDMICEADAVITTPSTAMLEVMLLQRPVALLDYHNTPKFMDSAWVISAREQIPAVVEELINPPSTKLAFQDGCLANNLRIDQPASKSVSELIAVMVALSREGRASHRNIVLPENLLGFSAIYGKTAPVKLADLYPEATVFQDDDPCGLQVRLARANQKIEGLEEQLRYRDLGYWVETAGRFMARTFRKKSKRKDR